MPEPKTNCTKCGREILQTTADRNGGLCGVCVNAPLEPRPVQAFKALPRDPVQLDVEIDMESLGTPENVAWDKVEEALVLLASEYVKAFSAIHADKQFYGFAFDCNADYGQVFVCVNTIRALKERAVEYKTRNAELYSRYSPAELEDHLRWALGDWEFQAFTTEGFENAWSPIEDFLCEAASSGDDDDEQAGESFREAFLTTACRAMVRIESTGALNALNRTDDFKTFVADHDESDDDSWNRLTAARGGSAEA